MLEGQTLRWERHCRKLPLPLQEWLDGVLHQDTSFRWTARESTRRIRKNSECICGNISSNPAQLSSGGVSADFLHLLDDVIINHDEEERKQREEEYRQKVEKSDKGNTQTAKEASWKEIELALWTEMESTWDKLISVLASGKLPLRKVTCFCTNFAEKVQAQRRNRECGKDRTQNRDAAGFCKRSFQSTNELWVSRVD